MTTRNAHTLTQTPWNDSHIFIKTNITLIEAHRLINLYKPEKQAEYIGDTEIDRYYITPDFVVIIETTKY